MAIHYSIDSIAMREDRVFGWGWAMCERRPLALVEILLDQPDGRVARIECLAAGSREDVAAAFPSVPHASASGFLMQGRLPQGASDVDATLVLHFASGEVERRPLPGFPHAFMARDVRAMDTRDRLRLVGQHLATHGLATTLRKLARTASDAYERHRCSPARLRAMLASGPAPLVVFDHAMGGGANRFRERRVSDHVRGGGVAVVVTPRLASMDYQVRIDGASRPAGAVFESLESLLDWLDGLPVGDLLLNDIVSFDRPFALLEWCVARRARGGGLVACVHDYFAVCPSWTLVDADGRFCGIPSQDRCSDCIARQRTPFLAFYRDVEIGEWRRAWSALFAIADRIEGYSQASIDLLMKGFPSLDPDRIALRPHVIDYLPDRRVTAAPGLPLVVAVIGHISQHKGAAVVARLAAHAAAADLPISIKVFGSLEGAASAAQLEVLGEYSAGELPDLLERHGIGLCLLPSICPETFSYVTAEVIHLGMPIAVFDLGAPAERVRAYPRGLVLSYALADSAPALADALLAFHARDAGVIDSLPEAIRP